MDVDGNSELDIDELSKALLHLGLKMNPLQMNAFRDDLDHNGDGRISLKEFSIAVEARKPKAATANRSSSIDAAWKVFS